MTNDIDTIRVTLKRHWVGISRHILVHDASPEVYCDLLGEMVCSLNGYVLGEDESIQRQVVRYPATWWDAVKERFAPRWFLRRYPAKYVVVELAAEAIYPHLNLQIPSEHSVVYITKRAVENDRD
jgi:hypothetical protein